MPVVASRAIESKESSPKRTLERLGGSGAIESAKGDDGSYRVRIITEGQGSSGVYSKALVLDPRSAEVLDGLPSFFDHPDYSWSPEDRSVLKIAGRFQPGTIETGVTEDGLSAVYGAFKPRTEYTEFFKEFADILGVSIYVAAAFTELPDGKRNVESFLQDPYNSIDIVVAAGRGGRFEQAAENLRTIESSLGITRGTKPTVEASAGEKTGDNMTKEELVAAFAEAVAPLVTAVAKLETAAAEKATAEASAEAVAEAVSAGVKSFAEKAEAINAEPDLLASQRTALLESARTGADITPALESARAFIAEAKTAFTHEPDNTGFVFSENSKTEGSAIERAISGGAA